MIDSGTRRRTRPRVGFGGAVLAAACLLLTACGADTEPSAGGTPTPSPTPTAALTAQDMWVKSAGSGMTAAFGTLANNTDAEITVTKAASTAAPTVELHEVAMVDGKMVMQPKESGFVIPAGGTHELKPGGDHLMLLNLAAPVRAGDEVTFTLTLADGESVEITAVGKDFAGGNESYQPDMPGMSPSAHTGS